MLAAGATVSKRGVVVGATASAITTTTTHEFSRQGSPAERCSQTRVLYSTRQSGKNVHENNMCEYGTNL